MKTCSYFFRNDEKLEKFILSKNLNESGSLLIQIQTCLEKKEVIKEILQSLNRILPKAHIIGATSSGIIRNHRILTGVTQIIFTQFENVIIESFYDFKKHEEPLIGTGINSLKNKSPKLIILYSDSFLNGEEIIGEIETVVKKTIITGSRGMKRSNNRGAYIFCGSEISSKGFVGITLSGPSLEAWIGYTCPWQPIGKDFTVTKCYKNKIMSLDNVEIRKVYEKYFGIKTEESLIDILHKFPLYQKDGNIEIARAGAKVSRDSFEFVGSFIEGTKVNFSVANKIHLFKIVKGAIEKYSTKNVETCFMHYNHISRNSLGNCVGQELRGYKKAIKSFNGIISDGEYYNSISENKNYFFSNSTTMLYMTENYRVIQRDPATIEKIKVYMESLRPYNDDPLNHLVSMSICEIKEKFENENSQKDAILERERLATVGQLMGGIAHNLNTPIMGASGQIMISNQKIKKLGLLWDENPELKKLSSGLIESLSENNSNVYNYLLYMSDVIEAVKNQVKSNEKHTDKTFTLQQLFEKTSLLMSFELKSKKMTITTFISELVAENRIVGDITALIQVLVNLIENAIESYGGEAGKINLGAEIEYKYPGIMPYIKIYVQDFGRGIEESVGRMLFNKMVTTKGYKGTGIGMYFSNIIIKARFEGYIDFKSESNKGTTMSIYLPLK